MSLGMVMQWLLAYKYFIVLPLAVLEGPILMVVCGFLLRQGYFDVGPLFFTLIVGDLVADLGWYGVGFWSARPLVRRFGRFLNLNEELVAQIEAVFHRHAARIIFISKITMGFGFSLATLITAGVSRIPLKKYMTVNLLGGIVWTTGLLTIGYFFGHLYLQIEKGLRAIALVVFIILLIGALWGIRQSLRKRLVAGKL